MIGHTAICIPRNVIIADTVPAIGSRWSGLQCSECESDIVDRIHVELERIHGICDSCVEERHFDEFYFRLVTEYVIFEIYSVEVAKRVADGEVYTMEVRNMTEFMGQYREQTVKMKL